MLEQQSSLPISLWSVFHAHPLSFANPLQSGPRASDEPMDQHPSHESLITDEIAASNHEYDRHIFEYLPALQTIDELII